MHGPRRGGQSAIVLVPEIALTPQTVDRFGSVFGDQVAVTLHRGSAKAKRLDAWRAIQRGDTRPSSSAHGRPSSPLDKVGAIVVDEEHESTLQAGEAPRYHAREVRSCAPAKPARWWCWAARTPSLESWVNAKSGKYSLAHAARSRRRRCAAEVNIVDLRTEVGAGAPPQVRALRSILSARLEAALHERLARNEQSLPLLNRRGIRQLRHVPRFVYVVASPQLRHLADLSSFARTDDPRLLPAHRGALGGVPGVQGGEHEAARRGHPAGGAVAQRAFSLGARVAHGRRHHHREVRAHTEILDRVGRGEVDILVGHADDAKGLGLPERDAGRGDRRRGRHQPCRPPVERTYVPLALSQVAGRAGRGPKGGEVFIQTRTPTHHARCSARREHDYLRFVAEELPGRESPLYLADPAAGERRGQRASTSWRWPRARSWRPTGCRRESRR